jgi:Holliday junction resolvasome RuvABC DNA-binding subunit
VNRVIAGEFGNGSERKKALEELGYIYTEVQKAVNNKLNAPKPITEELINNVIRGRYGNGAERKRAIELMGYDYEEVRRRVNERLKG